MLRDLPERLGTGVDELRALADTLTRGHLDGDAPVFSSPAPVLEAAQRLRYWRLRAAARREGGTHASFPASLLTGLATVRSPIAFLLWSDGEEACVALGAHPDHSRSTAQAVASWLGAGDPIALEALPWESFPPAIAALSGIPVVVGAGAPDDEATGVADVLLDSLRGRAFRYVVFATPEPTWSVRDTVRRLRSLAEDVERIHLQTGAQANVHRTAARTRDLLDRTAEHLEPGTDGGLFRVSALLGCERPADARLGVAVLVGLLAKPMAGGLVPLRGYTCASANEGPSVHCNVLHPTELASLCPLPRRDRIGFSLRPDARFDVDHEAGEADVPVGQILDGGFPTARRLELTPETLCRHALVVGHTGAGKSTTVRSILTALGRLRIPFLVLEPARAEYRSLASTRPDLCVLRAGTAPEPGEIPFLMNPFSFPAGFPLHTHIDYLKQAFVASFGLFPPTPYLLETAIYNAYQERGWDLATGRHPNGYEPLSFPTLTDLLAQVDPVVEAAGYDRELSRNLRGALRTRIGNLCLGPKGLSLDTRDELPDGFWLESPVVLEIRHLGSDEEKALVMGFVLTRLYELLESQSGGGEARLRHVLVIEEAHRLLRRTVERSTEEGNMAHQAVQTFASMLAEIRAYGEGVVVVDQIPSQLTPEVVKLTGLKVVHRLPPKDDRDLVGDTMALDPAQKRALALLPVGEAVAHAEGMDGAVRIRVAAPAPGRDPGDRQVVQHITDRLGSERVARLRRRTSRLALASLLVREDVRAAADGVLSAAGLGRPLTEPLERLARSVAQAQSDGRGDFDATSATRHALGQSLLRRALRLGWTTRTYEFLDAAVERSPVELAIELGRTLDRYVEGNHVFCRTCPRPCRVRYEGDRLANQGDFEAALRELLSAPAEDWPERLVQLVGDCAADILGWVGDLPAELLHCAVGHGLARLAISSRAQERTLAWLRTRWSFSSELDPA